LNPNPADENSTLLSSQNVAFMGCNIVEGQGQGIVIATGKDNQLAKIASQVNHRSAH
jgi:magnesium-transporting ATPase (P-type)